MIVLNVPPASAPAWSTVPETAPVARRVVLRNVLTLTPGDPCRDEAGRNHARCVHAQPVERQPLRIGDREGSVTFCPSPLISAESILMDRPDGRKLRRLFGHKLPCPAPCRSRPRALNLRSHNRGAYQAEHEYV